MSAGCQCAQCRAMPIWVGKPVDMPTITRTLTFTMGDHRLVLEERVPGSSTGYVPLPIIKEAPLGTTMTPKFQIEVIQVDPDLEDWLRERDWKQGAKEEF